jgi:hypothetical protein
MTYQLTSSGSYNYTWSNDGNASSAVQSGADYAISSDTLTTSSWSAFEPGTGCTISGQKVFGVYSFPVIVPTVADSLVCIGGSTTLNSNVTTSAFGVKCVPFGFRTAPAGATFLANNGVRNGSYGGDASLDDGGWDGVPIGFDFNYFGNVFTSVNVGTNGVINFGPYANFNASQYSFPSGFPSTSSPVNTIGVIATDFYMNTTGTVRFWTEGVAPARVFVIEYNGPGWTADGQHVAQAHLFETTGLVEIHVERATGAGTFAGPKTIGLQDGTGTIGSTAPVNCDASGNPSGSITWNARVGTISASNPQAWRFIPPVSYSFAWTPSGEISGSTTGASAIALPTATVPGIQTYEVTVTDNTSGCVGAPIQVQIELTEPVAQPDVVGFGVDSDVDGTNTVSFCAEQDLNLYVTAGAGYDSTYNAVWYTEAVGGTGFAIAYYDTVAYGIAGPAGLSADDTLYVAIDNGICEGPRRMVVLDYQEPDSLVITNSSPINCGPSSLTYTSNISVSSAGAYTYSWSAPAGVLDTNTGTDVVATINNTVNVVLTASDAAGFCTVTEVIPVSRFGFPEITPTAANDSICPGGGIQTVLSSNTVAQGFQIIGTPGTGYAPSTYTANTLVSNGVTQPLPAGVTNPNPSLDDGFFVVPIGFTFNFLGNDYTQLAISTNGNIQFGPTISTSFTPSFGTAAPNNFVALFWTDMDFGSGNGNNSIRYGVSGTAPNRVFSVGFDGCRFGSGGTLRLTGQIDLNETSGIIKLNINEVAAADAGFASGGDATVAGAENLDGTVGTNIPARTSTVSGGVITNNWSVTTPEGWTMLPPVDYSFNWVDLTSNPTSSIVGTSTQSTVTVAPTVTSQYQLIATANNTGCNNATANQAYVTVTIASAPPVVNFTADDVTPTTGGVQQTVTFTTSTPELGGDTYAWSFSPNNVVYVGGTSATSRNPQVQFTEPGAYSATLSMTSCTGTSSFTRPNYVIATAVYCFPYFGDGTGSAFFGCGDGDAVDDVTITNPNTGITVMAHLNTGCSNNTAVGGSYTDYSTSPVNGVTTATLYQGTTYTMTVGSINPAYTEFFGAWIDVDNDGDFNDPLEFLGGNLVAATSETFEIGIPTSNVIYGLHKMRIMAAFGSGPLDANSACLNGFFGEAHDYVVNIQPPAVLNDIPAFASNLAFSGNQFYPTITTLNGNTSLATNSPETASSVIGGPDVWVRFIAQSTAVSITMSSTVMDDIIALYSRDAAGNYILVASENASSGAGDFERLNAAGLTPGTQYWVAFGSNTGAGAFTYSVQHLMRSWCAYAIPAGGFSLCNTFKAVYRGAPSQGVTYKFNFTPTGSTGGVATSLAGTNGLINLSNATLALRHGGTYNASVDVTYVLQNSAGANEPINVLGSIADGYCTGVSISAHPLMEVRSNQRCPAVLLRGNYLVGVTVPGSITSFACGAINYTYEFTSVTSCVDGTALAPAVTFTTPAATPYLGLGVLPNIGLNAGAWDVRIRPNFSYGPGNFGPTQRISVNNTAASTMLDEEVAEMDVKMESFIAANLYPNPNNGDMVNLNVSGIESDNVFVRITDAMGRVVYTNRFSVEGSLNTIVTFSEPLASGIYNVEFTVDGEIMTERMIVAKQ